jgi:hypothetical protein
MILPLSLAEGAITIGVGLFKHAVMVGRRRGHIGLGGLLRHYGNAAQGAAQCHEGGHQHKLFLHGKISCCVKKNGWGLIRTPAPKMGQKTCCYKCNPLQPS